ncbi:MAG: alpha/beta fold hydrolase [Microbacteriaceae bacterium]|nr:alpha/beta fold hydrolase [Microbacteriaceae bacterium]
MPARRAFAATASLAAAALALTGCSLLPGTDGDTDSPPAGADRFYTQTLSWNNEGDLLDSTTVEVPLDWSDPDGATIEIAVMRHKATESSLGSLLMNPGGPGGSGYDYVRDYAEYLVTPDVLANFDLIGFDPRGVNHSNPVTCYTDSGDRDEYLYGTYDEGYGTEGWVEDLTQREKDYAAACAENTGPLLAHIDAGSVARDMDVIRAVLGDEKINYLGYSYGTYLGTVYAELFPDKVGRMVLDGAVDPTVSDLDALATQMAGFESALRAYMDDCQANDSNCPFSGGTDAGMQQVRQLLEGVDAQHLVASDGRVLDSATVGTGLAYNLYSDSYWPDLTQMFNDLYAHDPESSFANADGYNGRNSDGSYADNSSDVYAAVTCAEGDLGTDSVDTLGGVAVLQAKAPTIGDFFGYDDTFVLDALCSNWPYPVAELPTEFDAAGAAPIIVIGTTNDPATPYANAVSLSKQLESGVLISYEGEGHTIYAQGVTCVDDAVDAYFIEGTVPAEDPKC